MFELTNNYNLVCNCRKWSDDNVNEPKKGGGLAFYTRNNLKYPENDFSYLNNSSRDIESKKVYY